MHWLTENRAERTLFLKMISSTKRSTTLSWDWKKAENSSLFLRISIICITITNWFSVAKLITQALSSEKIQENLSEEAWNLALI